MKLIWLDLETTGLDPIDDLILEIAVSEADLMKPFEAIPIYHRVLPLSKVFQLNDFVRTMHTQNGLLAECYSDKVLSASHAEEELLKLIPAIETRGDMPVLAGSSVHFDHDFLKRHMPRLAARFSHRHYDVSAVKLFCESLGMPKLPKAEAHRAREDVHESIDHANRCMKWLRP